MTNNRMKTSLQALTIARNNFDNIMEIYPLT